MPTRAYQKINNKNNNTSNPSNLASYEFEYRENKNPEYQYISDDNRNKLLTNKITTRKDRSEMRRERHREEDDKFHIGLLFGCLVLSYLLNFAYGFQAGTTMYGVVFTIGLVIWAVVALMSYFREDKE